MIGDSVKAMTEDPFLTHRGLLFTVAYEILGSAADAEDVLQESWLRWADIDQTQVHDPRGYAIRIVSRQSLNRFSIAMLTVLETLGPTERAVFVLREVFDLANDEIAEAIGRSSPAVRQIARRAREHVASRQPRVHVSRSEQEAVVRQFLTALQTGHLQSLMDLVAPDVVLIADGGGLAPAVLNPIQDAGPVTTFLSRANRARHFPDCNPVAQRRGGRPDRDRWPVGQPPEPRGGERTDHPDLPDAKPPQADTS